jgi:serine/threonine-protein kinase
MDEVIMVGTTVGTYRVLAKLGEGGMGEVYRATDLALGRDVALKIIAPRFARDAQWLQRFDHEARLLASLNHPNVGAIYHFERGASLQALVLELVEGQTLHERLRAGPVPAAEVVTIARQIVDALCAAHDKGIVHRDLKPANIKAGPDREGARLRTGEGDRPGGGRFRRGARRRAECRDRDHIAA